MTQAEELRLHNLFIKFKNEGKTLSKIKDELGIDDTLLREWNKNLTEAKKQDLELPEQIKSIISGVNEDGQYLYNNTFSFTISNLEKVKLDLQRIIQIEMDSDFAISQREKAKKFLPVFEKYFDSITSIKINEDDFNVEYKLNTDAEEVKLIVNEAIMFYGEFYYGEQKYRERIVIKDITKDTYTKAKNILPYTLKSLKIHNFNGITQQIGFEQLPIDTQWIFLIGENGFGKTTLLQAIAIGLFGEKDEDKTLVRSGFNGAKIGVEFFYQSKSIIHNIGVNFNSFPYLACYGPSRLQIQTDQAQNDIAKKSTTTYSLFNSDGILLNIEFELLIWFLEKNEKFEKVKSVFLKLIPYLSDIQVDVPNRKILYIEKEPTEDGDTYNPVTFEQLASGFRSLILMVGDMIIRLFKSQPTINEPSELAGIVIIDELDLHWHPKLQRELPKLLSSIFPKVQFIASTHSLVPLLGAPENSVFLQVNRTKEAGITVERITEDIGAFSADKLLRDVFDLDNKYMSDEKIKAWERYLELKKLIRFEENGGKKETYLNEYETLGDKYNFSV
ncbi:MAG: AAA family ATPase [Emticicia sp.]|uniref:AAA family ATPase n=1 Tax=Emticicia sp. TaxID=1930953 RepID=UPI003BA487AF